MNKSNILLVAGVSAVGFMAGRKYQEYLGKEKKAPKIEIPDEIDPRDFDEVLDDYLEDE